MPLTITVVVVVGSGGGGGGGGVTVEELTVGVCNPPTDCEELESLVD